MDATGNNILNIVIPYYKIDFFEETLLSLSKQTNKNFNLYIGNDNSPQDPTDIINKYSSIIKKYIKFPENIGGGNLANQWMRCIDTFVIKEENFDIRNSWVMLLCDDDILSENYVEEFYNHLPIANEKDISLIKYNCKIIDQNSIVQKGPFNYPPIIDSCDLFGRLYNNTAFSTLSENIFRVDKYLKYKFKNIELAYGSDAIAVLEFSEFQNIIMVNNAFMHFRDSGINISGIKNDYNIKLRKMKGNIEYMEYLLSNYKNKFSYSTQLEMCKMLYRNFRIFYRKSIFANIKYLWLIFKTLKFKDFKKIIFKQK